MNGKDMIISALAVLVCLSVLVSIDKDKKPTQRPKQNDCRNEPIYPDHSTIVISIRNPELCVHMKQKGCKIEYPHKISECNLFKP